MFTHACTLYSASFFKFQGVCMFVGEFLCVPTFFVLHLIQKLRYKYNTKSAAERLLVPDDDEGAPSIPRFNPFVFLPPAMCDMCATSLMYIGLNLTYASSFQMLRGLCFIVILHLWLIHF